MLAHTHAQDELVTVIEGTWYLGEGAKFESAKLKGYPAGSFNRYSGRHPSFCRSEGKYCGRTSERHRKISNELPGEINSELVVRRSPEPGDVQESVVAVITKEGADSRVS